MTFTEAAIAVLRREGQPLHFRKIAEIAVRESLLDHVGKVPEEVMGGQLAAHCRLPRLERRLLAVQPGTFALVEWGLAEDPAGLENLAEAPPGDELPYRPRERHPMVSREVARSAGRDGGRSRRRDEGQERRGRRFPPPAEVAYEILAGADRPLGLTEIAVIGAERLVMPDAFVRDVGSLAAALREDNRRREAAGKKALFALEGETVTLAAQPEPGERAAAAVPVSPRLPSSAAEMRRTALAALRRRIRECDAPTVEQVAVRLLERMGLRELKVAKRAREQVVYTGRKRLGLTDVRHCVRVVRSGSDLGRREVVEARRDLGHYGAQIGILVTAGDAAREARGEAGAAGQMPVLLLCGEALAEALTEAGVGVSPVVIPEIDEGFFRAAAEAAEREEAARRSRREERERRAAAAGEEARAGEGEPVQAFAPPQEEAALRGEAQPGEHAAGAPEAPGGDDEEEGEGDEATEAGVAGASAARDGEGRRRRRRRRRRGGGGRGRGERRVEGAAASGSPAEGPPSGASGEGAAPGRGEAAAPLEPPGEPPTPGGGGEGT